MPHDETSRPLTLGDGRISADTLIGLAILAVPCFGDALHRATHESPALWRIHAVHHRVGQMDWSAGSHLHLAEPLAICALVLLAGFVPGMEGAPLLACITLAATQVGLTHAHPGLKLAWPDRLLVTPRFRHGHDRRDAADGDRLAVPGPLRAAPAAKEGARVTDKEKAGPDHPGAGVFSGGANRNRTDDLLNAIQALSQLSYGPPERGLRITPTPGSRKGRGAGFPHDVAPSSGRPWPLGFAPISLRCDLASVA